MARQVRIAVALALLLALAGATPAAGGPATGAGDRGVAGPADAVRATVTTATGDVEDANTAGTAGARTTTATSPGATDGPAETTGDPGVETVGFDPDYDAAEVLARVEALRGLSATDRIVVHEYDDRNGTASDIRDQFGAVRPVGARALQLYSNASTESRVPLGYTVERDDGVHVHLMDAEDLDAFGVPQQVVLAHEFVHALQFQHDLISPSRERLRSHFDRWTTDARLVATAVVEGDAMWTTQQYLDRYGGGNFSVASYNRTLAREAWPNSVARTPYYYGYQFYRATGATPEERSAAISDPPASTAALLHPDEDVARAPLPDPPADSQAFNELTRYHQDTVGELVIRHALRVNGVSFGRAAAAADGWVNGRMDYYVDEATTATHWVTVWTDDDQAREFAEAWRSMLADRGAATSEDGTLVVPATDDAPAVHYVIERTGGTVRITAAPNADLAEQLARFGAGEESRGSSDRAASPASPHAVAGRGG